MPSHVTILLVEDDPDDQALTLRALHDQTSANIEIARHGQAALDYLLNPDNDLPRVVLLDLRVPNPNGLEVLRRIRADTRTCLTPVVILTGSAAPGDIAAGYRHGANGYVRKPVDFDRFAKTIREIGTYWLVVNQPPAPLPRDHS